MCHVQKSKIIPKFTENVIKLKDYYTVVLKW